MAIRLSDEAKQDLVASIQRYFREKTDEEIGNLPAQLLLDFVLREVGPFVYNQAIRDAQSYFQDRVIDLEGSCYEPEMTYWQDSRGSRKR
jgi:uncharacterized protein (DUF2164 family)